MVKEQLEGEAGRWRVAARAYSQTRWAMAGLLPACPLACLPAMVPSILVHRPSITTLRLVIVCSRGSAVHRQLLLRRLPAPPSPINVCLTLAARRLGLLCRARSGGGGGPGLFHPRPDHSMISLPNGPRQVAAGCWRERERAPAAVCWREREHLSVAC